MSNQRCVYCGNSSLNCDCFDPKEWNSFEDLQPVVGQKCRIKREHVLEAYYSGNGDSWVITACHEPQITTSWRPLYGIESES